MERITIFDHNRRKIGLYTRTPTEGEELELVREFISYYCDNFLRYNKKNNLAVFIEPKVASGFPDIVFASYSPKIMENWSCERERLTLNDLKILSYLTATGGCTSKDIGYHLKFSDNTILQAVENLMDAGMILRNNGMWKPAKLEKIYSIKKLVSVEAKITDMKKVAEQSLINTWFASESYALTRSASPQSCTIDKFESQGTGLYCKDKGFRKIVKAKKLKLPSSYQSFLFNEWIGRALSQES